MSIDPTPFLSGYLLKAFGTRPTDPKLAAAWDKNLANNPIMKTANQLFMREAAKTPDQFNKELIAKGATQAQIDQLNNDVALAKARGDLDIRGGAIKQNTDAIVERDTAQTDNDIRSALKGQLPIMNSAQAHEMDIKRTDDLQAGEYRNWAAAENDKNRELIARTLPTGTERFIGMLLQGVGAIAPFVALKGLG